MSDETEDERFPQTPKEAADIIVTEIRKVRHAFQMQFAANMVIAVFLLMVLLAVLGDLNSH